MFRVQEELVAYSMVNDATGNFAIQNDHDFTAATQFDNAGAVTVGANIDFVVPAGSNYT